MDFIKHKPEKLKHVKRGKDEIMQQSALRKKLDKNSNVVYEYYTNNMIICKLF